MGKYLGLCVPGSSLSPTVPEGLSLPVSGPTSGSGPEGGHGHFWERRGGRTGVEWVVFLLEPKEVEETPSLFPSSRVSERPGCRSPWRPQGPDTTRGPPPCLWRPRGQSLRLFSVGSQSSLHSLEPRTLSSPFSPTRSVGLPVSVFGFPIHERCVGRPTRRSGVPRRDTHGPGAPASGDRESSRRDAPSELLVVGYQGRTAQRTRGTGRGESGTRPGSGRRGPSPPNRWCCIQRYLCQRPHLPTPPVHLENGSLPPLEPRLETEQGGRQSRVVPVSG